MLTRAVSSASRTACTVAAANLSGSGVSAPDVGVNLVSILKRMWPAFARRTRSNTSINVGMRTPSMPRCSGKAAARAVPGFKRPTSSRNLPSGPRVWSGLRRLSWLTTRTPSLVMARSSSSVVTPIDNAVLKASSVFSGAKPRAPRWPCRSNALAGKARTEPTIAAAMVFAMESAPQARAAASSARCLRRLREAIMTPSRRANGAAALPDQSQRDEKHQHIRDPIEQLGRRAPRKPQAEKIGGDRERQEHKRGRQSERRELAEREIGHELHYVHQREEDDGRADERELVEPLRQDMHLVGRSADLDDGRGETRERAPEHP